MIRKLVRTRHFPAVSAVILVLFGAPSRAWSAGHQGDFVQTDTLGMNVISHDFTTGTTKYLTDATVLSEFIGLHYFIVDGVRLGMNLQFSETLQPEPAAGKSRFATFALLPQIGWDFYGPMFAALVFTIAPRTSAGDNLDLGLQGVIGAGFPIADRVKMNLALEVPYNFKIHTTLGLTPLVGIGIRL